MNQLWCLISKKEKWEYKDGKRVYTTTRKYHKKSNSFWVLKYSKSHILWASVVNHEIYHIWLEDLSLVSKKNSLGIWTTKDNKEKIKLIFDISKNDTFRLHGRSQIIDLLPKELKRDFLLDQLFG